MKETRPDRRLTCALPDFAEASELDAMLDRLLDGESLCADEIELKLKQKRNALGGVSDSDVQRRLLRSSSNNLSTSVAVDAATVRSASPATLFRKPRTKETTSPNLSPRPALKVFCSCPVVAQCIDSSVSSSLSACRRRYVLEAAIE